jgi:hypothetical protein
MPRTFIRHSVKDCGAWTPCYDDPGKVSKTGSAKESIIFKNVDNPKEIFILNEWDEIEKARKIIQLKDFCEVMQRIGVL